MKLCGLYFVTFAVYMTKKEKSQQSKEPPKYIRVLKILSIFSLCLTMLLLGVVNGATYVVKTDIGQDILKKVSIALRPHTPTIMWLCFALLTIYIFARLIIKKWNANDKISDIDRITNRAKNERDKASKAKEGIFNLRNSILLEDIQTSGKVKDELAAVKKDLHVHKLHIKVAVTDALAAKFLRFTCHLLVGFTTQNVF